MTQQPTPPAEQQYRRPASHKMRLQAQEETEPAAKNDAMLSSATRIRKDYNDDDLHYLLAHPQDLLRFLRKYNDKERVKVYLAPDCYSKSSTL